MTWIEINSFALLHNARKVREAIGDGLRILAVVKANAYGHGLDIASEAFWRAGVDGFVVTETAEALALSEKRYRVPILLLHPPETHYLHNLLERKIRLSVQTLGAYHEIKSAATRYGLPAVVHLELETGMHRLGLAQAEILQIIQEAQSPQSVVRIEGLFTHLHSPTDSESSERQLSLVHDLLFHLQQKQISIPWVHVLASRSALLYPQSLYDGIRAGAALYGFESDLRLLEFALTWKTRLVSVSRLRKGGTVGYSATYKAERDMPIGVIPVGFADGLDRRLSSKGHVLVKGKRCPIIGRVCMNSTIIDLSSVLQVAAGEEVVLLGLQSRERITPEEMAQTIDTTAYEVLARLPSHIERMKTK